MLDEETIERIVEQVLRRLLAELASDGRPLPVLNAAEAAKARASLGAGAPPRAPAPPRPSARQRDHAGRLLSEDEVVQYFREGVRVVGIQPRCIITPAARDRARDLQVDLVEA